LEAELKEANNRVQSLTSTLNLKQEELGRRLKEAHHEATARVHHASQTQFAKLTELEQKLLESDTCTKKHEGEIQALQKELDAVVEKLQGVTKERDEALASLQSAKETLAGVGDSEKSAVRTSQKHVAELQKELWEIEKEKEALQADIARAEKQKDDMECLYLAAQTELSEKNDELEGTKCMMETYEEKFIERETEMDVLMEEKEFAGRELVFARSEVKRLTESVKEHHLSAQNAQTAAADEIKRLQESLNMAEKELSDQREQTYDRERDFQDQLTHRNTHIAGLMDDLVCKERARESAELELQELKLANEELRRKYENQLEKANDLVSSMQSEQTAALLKRDDDLGRLSQANSFLEAENNRLKDAANQIYNEKCLLVKNLQAAKFELSDSKIMATKMQDALLQRVKELDSKVKDSQTQLKTAETKNATLTGRLERANAKIRDISADIESKDVELQAAASTIKSLEDERGQLTRREAQQKSDIEEKEMETQRLQASIHDANSRLSEATSRVSYLDRQINDFEAAKRRSEQERGVLNEEIASLNLKVSTQRDELNSKSSELSTLSLEMMNMETMLENLKDELKQRNEEIDAAQRSIITAQSQYAQLHERFVNAAEESSSKLQQLTSELIEAQDDLEDGVKLRAKMEQQILTTKQLVQDSDSNVSSLRLQLQESEEKVMELSSRYESAQKESASTVIVLRDELQKLSALTKQLERECDDRTRDNSQLQVHVSGLEKKLASARSLFGTEQSKQKAYRAEMEGLISTKEQEMTILVDQLQATSSELERKRQQLQQSTLSYEDQISDLENKIKAKETKLAGLSREKEENTETISSLQEALSKANLDIQRGDEARTRSRNEVASLNALIETLRSDNECRLEALTTEHSRELASSARRLVQADSALEKAAKTKEVLEGHVESLQKILDEEREKTQALLQEQDALTYNLHRAEDLAADLAVQLSILKDERADQSVDSIDSQILSLSKSELRMKCKDLSEEIQESEFRTAAANASLSHKQLRIQRLEEVFNECKDELNRMVESSQQLESALLKARVDKAACESNAEALRASVDVHQAKTTALKDELDRRNNENSELLDQVRKLQQNHNTFAAREDQWLEDLEKAKQVILLLDEEKISAENEIAKITNELESQREERETVEAKLSESQLKVSKLEQQLSTTQAQKDTVISESHSVRLRLEEQLQGLRKECASISSSLASMELENENRTTAICRLEETKLDLEEKLTKERKDFVRMESLREKAVTELTEASRVVAAQDGIIKNQEARVAEAELKAKQLSDEVSSLREAISTMESAKQESGVIRSSQLEELEKKRTILEQARLHAKAESDGLRDEVRRANRKASDLDRINKSLQTRIDDLKTTAETTKAQLREVRSAWEASENVAKKLENDLQSGRAEIDHLRMKLQLGGATIARLKSDRVLLQEAAMQANIEKSSSDPLGVAREMSKLKSELHTRASQLSSASNSLRNYKKMCCDLRTTEKQLVIFIDDIISQADATFVALANLAEGVRESSSSMELASSGTPQKIIDDASSCLHQFLTLISEASADLEVKRRKLNNWKGQSKIHTCTSTPQNKPSSSDALLTPNQSSAMRAFRKMKEAMENQLSAVSEYPEVESAICSLELQIDALCSDLNSANQALCEKDKLFATLEQERNAIQKTMASVPTNGSSKLSAIQEGYELDKEKLQIAGASMICKVFENKAKCEAASAMTKWASSTAAMHATERQHHAAEALSNQLEMTRDTLAQLKAQVRRGKAGGNSGSSNH
jgi:chromosome segregation ATPase